jgi:Rad52/22 family double-strand break repair protein
MSTEDTDLSPNSLAPIEPSGLSPGGDEKHRLLMQTLSEAQVDFLMQRTPKREIKMRAGRGGLQFAYVEHGYVTERLNLVFGFNWDYEVVDKQILDDEVIVEARLTVRTPGGQTIVKTQFGGAEIKRHASGPRSGRPLSIADDYKAAASDALKKCASLLGIGLDLYGRDRPDSETSGEEPQPQPQPQPQARPQPARPVIDATARITDVAGQGNGMSTPAQQREIRRLALVASMDVDELCSTLGVPDLAGLTEARARRVINRLEELASQAEAS